MTRNSLIQFINDSTLPNDDKEMWNSVLRDSVEEDFIVLSNFIGTNAKRLEFLNSNIKDKGNAFIKNDNGALANIVAKEKEYIDKL